MLSRITRSAALAVVLASCGAPDDGEESSPPASSQSETPSVPESAPRAQQAEATTAGGVEDPVSSETTSSDDPIAPPQASIFGFGTSCSPNPCQNGGTCIDQFFGYTCRCPTGFTGTQCQTRGQTGLPLGSECSTPAVISGECGATETTSFGCFKLADNPAFCVSSQKPCPAGTVSFGGVCLTPCTPGGSSCPSPITKCQVVYPTFADSPAFCVRPPPDRPVAPLWTPCQTPAMSSPECGFSASGTQNACYKIGANPSFCASTADPCPTGTEKFGGAKTSPCLRPCTPGPFGGCPLPFSKCQPIYPWSDSPAYCVL